MAKYDQVVKKVGVGTVDEIVAMPTMSVVDLPTISVVDMPTMSVADFPAFYKRYYPPVPTESYVAGKRLAIAAVAANYDDTIADLAADKYLYGIIFALNSLVDGDYIAYVRTRTGADVAIRNLIENIYIKGATMMHRVVLPIPQLVETGQDVEIRFVNTTAAANTLWWDLEWLQ